MMIQTLLSNPKLFTEFRAAYNKAAAAGDETFMFHEAGVLVEFAKYAIEHIENQTEGK